MTPAPSTSVGSRGLRVVFTVLGEGRGHMTQALALAHHLRAAGHEVVGVFVGGSAFRPVPAYFSEAMGCEVVRHEAAMLGLDPHRRGISPWATARSNAGRLGVMVRDGVRLSHQIRSLRPDVIVNFYDLVAGLTGGLLLHDIPQLAIAHNYLLDHPDAGTRLTGGRGPAGLRLLSRANSVGARRTLVLSFDRLEPWGPYHPVPPLLREGPALEQVRDDGFLLAYVLNPGYAAELARWHASRGDLEVHCFVEGGEAGPELAAGFHAHDLDGEAFLEHLARCRAYVGTAGFESLCEAFKLGKPMLAIPVEGHIEQTFNAADAARVGAARAGCWSDLDDFWRAPQRPDSDAVEAFRSWLAEAGPRIVSHVEEVARQG